jgi:hypothetical protein
MKRKERSRIDPIKGNCKACGTEYLAQIYEFDESPYNCGYVNKICPNCSYTQDLENIVSHIVTVRVEGELRISKNGSVEVKYNSKEVTKEILDSILKYWPKPNKK